jgi:hypothetical protein
LKPEPLYAEQGLGEHLGHLLTALHVGLITMMQNREASGRTALLGAVTTALITVGAMEGPVVALGVNASAPGLAAIAGYLALTAWLILSGVNLLRLAPREATMNA